MNSFLFFYPEKNPNLAAERKFAKIKGAMVEYIEDNGRCRLVRVISSDPHKYLDSELSPGTDITSDVNSSKK